MEPAEVALVVDGQAFQKVCLETGVAVRPPVQTRVHPSGAMYVCVRDGVWVLLFVCMCARACAHTLRRQDIQVTFPFQVGLSVTRHNCKHFTCSLSH